MCMLKAFLHEVHVNCIYRYSVVVCLDVKLTSTDEASLSAYMRFPVYGIQVTVKACGPLVLFDLYCI